MNISSRARNALFCCVVLGLSATAEAKPGDLDKHFGASGITSYAVSGSVYTTQPAPITVDHMNRVIAVANLTSGAQIEVLTPNGDVDLGFGSSGAVYVDASVQDIAVDSLNRIVVLQTDTSASPQLTRISRFEADGSVDASFGSSGSVELASGLNDTVAGGMAIDGADNIYVAGTVFDAASSSEALMYAAKITQLGALDSSFGGIGFNVLQLDPTMPEDSVAWGIALDASSQPILTGVSVEGGSVGMLDVVRLTADGELDTGFGHGSGFVRTDTLPTDGGPRSSIGESVTTDGVGNIVVAANALSFSKFDMSMVLLRYTSKGDLDSTFGGGQPLFLGAPSNFAQARSVKVDGRGQILVSGMMLGPTFDQQPTIFRTNADGTIDTTFGPAPSGELQLPVLPPSSGGSIALAHDGNIVTTAASNTRFTAWVTKILDHDPLGIEYPPGF